jgi:5-dehydro-4-deoxyglucarate dehydratase
LVLPPSINDDGLAAYYRTIGASTELGVVLFQTPAFNFSVGLLRCLREVPNIVGMKDEPGDMKQFVRQWRAASDRLELLCGVGEILAPSYFALGVKGFTSGIVNFMPRTPLRIMELLRTGQLKSAAEVVKREAMPVFDLRGKRPGYTTVMIKEEITLCGLDVGPPRPPLAPLAPADREELRTLLRQMGILKSQTA